MHNECNRNLLDRYNIPLSAWTYGNAKELSNGNSTTKIHRCSCTHLGLSILCKRTRCNIVSENGYYAFVHMKAFSTLAQLCYVLSLFLIHFFFIHYLVCVCWCCCSCSSRSQFAFVHCVQYNSVLYGQKFYMTDYLLSCQVIKGSAFILIYFSLYISVVNCAPLVVYH